MAKQIFISHRHDDHEIASVFSKHFQLWSVPLSSIFQSSDYRASTVIGEPLRPQLRQALSEARLVLLIYTTPDKDWEFCLWECGVATNPSDETPETRIVLFQAGATVSRVFGDDVVFKLEKDDLRKFVAQFHKHVGFFIRDRAFQPEVHGDILETRAESLYRDLMQFSLPGTREERYRWDRFTLALSAAQARQLRDASEREDRYRILKESATVGHSFGQALLHFGYTTGARELTLGDLVARWERSIQGDPDTPRGWIDELCDEMHRSIEDVPARPSWEVMKSSQYPGWWFYPILNHTRALPDGSFEFDVYMYRIPGALPADVELPPV